MKRLLLSFIVLLLTPLHNLSFAFEDPSLAVAASQYHQSILDRYATADAAERSQALRQALRYSRQGLWQEAITEYEKLIGSGENLNFAWLRLGEAWQGDNKRSKRNDYRQRALQAAYNAYITGEVDSAKARALFMLGDLYAKTNKPKLAIASWKESLGLEENPELAQRYRKLVEAHAFRVTGVDVESNSATPKICLTFSEPLKRASNIHYEDYLQITPAIDTVATARDERLCIEGVTHGQQYNIELRPGISAKSGETITQPRSFVSAVANREATLGFRGSAYILPKSGGQGLPLTSVNVDKVRITVLRVNDRNLVRELDDGNIFRTLDGYSSSRISKHTGEQLWQGEMEIGNELNQEVTTAIPMQDVIERTEPGIYVVTADDLGKDQERWRELATQWLIVSDLGISTFQGEDGLHVFIRSLDNGTALSNITLRLFARNNSKLVEVNTDDQGYARLDPGLLRGKDGQAATVLMAYNGSGDFNFIDLTGPSFDLSDRGVGGRAAPGPVDVFLYSERGVYRPGETVHLTALMRDDQAYVLQGSSLPLTLKLIRPDEVVADEYILTQSELGGYYINIPLSNNARTGSWQVQAYTDPAAKAVGQLRFQVEDFVPQRLKLTLNSDAKALLPGQPVDVDVEGRFLYGAPAANLGTEAELVLREDPDPYPEFPGYQFGLVQENWDAKRYPLKMSATDDQGLSQVAMLLDEVPEVTRPLKALLRVSLFEPGGRPVNQVLGLPYRTQPFAIGVKAKFDDAVEMGQPADFEVIAVDAEGQQIGMSGLQYQLYREDYHYYWYFRNNRWDYKLIIRDSDPISSQSITLNASQPFALTQPPLDWGRYRAEIYDPNSGVATSVRFRVGWFVEPSAGDTPDKLELTLDKNQYQPGETARVHVKAPFAGEVLLTIADNQLRETRSFTLDQQGTTIELPVNADWGPGVYLLATAFRPAAADVSAQQRGPGRAIGVSWLNLEPKLRTLDVAIDAPQEFKPRQTVDVPVTINNMQPGQSVFLTLAAVDEGILQLTDYATPNPVDYYLGKRRLGLAVKDVYGKLIEADNRTGTLKVGGDMAGRNLDGSGVRTVKTVALFSGPIEVGSDGQVSVPLNLPDFNGELRLMAIAWDQARVGVAEKPLLVRDPLVARVYLPRFLAIDDVSQITLNVQNLSALPGDYQVGLFGAGAVSIEDSAPLSFQVSDSSVQNSEQRRYRLRGVRPGTGYIIMQVDGPAGFSLRREWEIGVRPAQTYVSERSAQRLPSGDTLMLNSDLLSAYFNDTVDVQLSLSNRPNLNVPGLLAKLDRYPYGCLEQTTSRALPLLYFNEVTQNWGGNAETPLDNDIRNRVQNAIQRVFSMQQYSGGFGLWNENSPTEMWLSAYTLDFLTRAREQDYLVSAPAYQRGLDWLKQTLNGVGYESKDLIFRSYALYVLARAEQAPLGELRYLHDNYLLKLPTQIARAQLGAALARYGDQTRAREALELALAEAQDPNLRDYGSPLRDRAAVLTLISESGLLNDQVPALADQLADSMNDRRYTSTQEQSWLLLAAHALLQDASEPLQLAVNGQMLNSTEDYYLSPEQFELEQGMEVVNLAGSPVWTVLNVNGVPASPQPPAQEGFNISRRYYNRDGIEINPADIQQNDVLVAVISGEALTDQDHQALIVDLLPAGLEVENPSIGKGESTGDLNWLPKLSRTSHTQLLDDRYIAALDLQGNNNRKFALAYTVRAVTPGDYAAPAVFVEDMYKPWYHARGSLGQMAIR